MTNNHRKAQRGSLDGQIGFGRPPKSGQFKTGTSGNPTGRPKKRVTPDSIVEEVYLTKVSITDEHGKRKIPLVEALLRKELELAIKGNPRAIKSCLERMEKCGLIGSHPWPKDLSLKDLTDRQLDQFIALLKHRVGEE
jgi:hypothetical protein